MDDKKATVISQFHTDCLKLSENSLQCSIENQNNLQNCTEHFEMYKECRKQENRNRRAKNRAKSAAK